VSAYQDTRVTPTLAASKESAMRTQTVDLNVPARTTSVLTPVLFLVARVLTALYRTTSLSVGVPGVQLETPSGTAEGSQERRFVLLVEQTLTVRLDKMTVPSVGASLLILETPFKDVDMNVRLTRSVVHRRSVTVSTTDVSLHVVMEPVERMPTAKLSTTGHNVLVLRTSLETHSLGATQNVPDTMTVPLTRPVSSSSVETHATTPTPMCVDREPPVRRPIIKQSAPVQEVIQEIHL